MVRAFAVQNPDTRELALHAVYLVDAEGRVFYRKVARRRPVSAELIDAIDAHRGIYPQHDAAKPRRAVAVAYPQNPFQALLELSQVDALPATVDPAAFSHVHALVQARRLDDAMFAFKHLVITSDAAEADLLDAAAWLVRATLLEGNAAAADLGRDLQRRLDRVRALETLERGSVGTPQHDAHLHALAAARAGLTRLRADISRQSAQWRLDSAKTMLRGYREVVLAAARSAAATAER